MKNLIKMSILAMIFILLNSCSGNLSMVSEWSDDPVVIDGKSDEWEGNLFSIDKTTLGMGIKNDDKNIYIRIVNGSRNTTREIMTKGFFIWFDEKGKSKKRVGIKYPIGNIPDFTQNRENRRNFTKAKMPITNFINPEFEFYMGEDDKVLYPTLNNEKHIEMEILNGPDKFVYELKVPIESILQNTESKDLEKLGIGIEIASFDRASFGDRSEMDRGSGRDGMQSPPSGRGMGGGRSGGMGGGRGMKPMQNQSTNPVKKWIKVELDKK